MAQVCPICNNEFESGAAACPYCGFRVMGSTQSFKPVKLDKADDVASTPVKQHRELHVARGPQTGVDISLHEGTMTVGRDPRCDIFLNDMTVSRDHAVIEASPKGCVITDQNSFNGVWVNDRMVDTCLLQPGDVIQIGAFCLVYKEKI